jgi:hypothetical protein
MLACMAFRIPLFARDLIERWWQSICESVDGLFEQLVPDGLTPVLRLPRIEVQAMADALDIFEAMMRRMLLVLAAQHGPAPAPADLPELLFRIDECPPLPVIRKVRETDPDFCLKPPPERALPTFDPPTDGLVSTAGLLRRIRALIHLFDNGEAYMQAMRARFCAPQPPLPPRLPAAFTGPALTPAFGENLRAFHEIVLDAQASNTS